MARDFKQEISGGFMAMVLFESYFVAGWHKIDAHTHSKIAVIIKFSQSLVLQHYMIAKNWNRC